MHKLIFLVFTLTALMSKAQTPKTVMDFFMALPQEYFVIECCNHSKQEYIKMYLEINDTKNGYLKAGADGAQDAIEMTLFKEANANYIIAITTNGEEGLSADFLEFNNGKWNDVAKTILPINKEKYVFELPRTGTTIKVYNIKKEEWGIDKGKFVFNLKWNKEKFIKE